MRPRRTILLPAVAVGILLLVSACGSAATDTSTSSSAAAANSSGTGASPSPAQGAAVTVGTSSFGPMIVDSRGRTLYLFEADSGTTSTCSGACAQAWPPFLTHGAPQAGTGASATQLGTSTRADGSMQVTYAGHPLYFFASDTKPGDTTGEGVNSFGAGWDMLTPAGQKIEKPGA
jgi:predicted lipoprotein with Yx(FWY)xxD motif